jgi:predicted DsbA family dithiol-disulfide isomerase
MLINIDIISDIICPWCFIGRRRLQKALAMLEGELEARLVWRPFELNPTMPREGMERTRYLAMKFGSQEQAQKLYENIAALGAEEGIEFHFEHISRTPNTFDAHRLIWWASQQGLADETAHELFQAYFVEGIDVGLRPALAEIAERVGLDRLAAQHFLESSDGSSEVRQELSTARELGISGVPFFIFNGRYGLSGAQHPDTLISVLKRVEAITLA